MSGYTESYNRTLVGTAHAIIGYTLDGGGLCPACADSSFSAAILAGTADPVRGDAPAPLFSINAASFREGGDHRGGCGLSCDPCGAVIVAACDSCREGIEGGDYAPRPCRAAGCSSILYYPDEGATCGEHGEGGRPMA